MKGREGGGHVTVARALYIYIVKLIIAYNALATIKLQCL